MRYVMRCLTFWLIDPAPMMSDLQERRDRGVRCCRFVRLGRSHGLLAFVEFSDTFLEFSIWYIDPFIICHMKAIDQFSCSCQCGSVEASSHHQHRMRRTTQSASRPWGLSPL